MGAKHSTGATRVAMVGCTEPLLHEASVAEKQENTLQEEVLVWVPPDKRSFAADFTTVAKRATVEQIKVALRHACRDSDVDYRFSFTDHEGRMSEGTMLHLASIRGYLQIVPGLLAMKADVNAIFLYEKEASLIHRGSAYAINLACRSGKASIVEELVNHGADINAEACFKGKALHKPIFDACQASDPAAILWLIDHGVDINKVVDKKGRTPLHVAVLKNSVEAVVTLVRKGANIAAVSKKEGRTPVDEAFLAPGGCDSTIVETLLKGLYEANVDTDINTKIHFVDSLGRKAIGTLLHVACRAGLESLVQTLLEKQADVNADYEFTGRTGSPGVGKAVHLAISAGGSSMLSRLLEHKADPKACVTLDGERSSTTVLEAAWFGNVEALLQLDQEGIRISDPDYFWGRTAPIKGCRTPLHIAAMRAHVEVAKTLVEMKADLNRRDKLGKTPIDEALAFPAPAQGPMLNLLFNGTVAEVCRIAKVRPNQALDLAAKVNAEEVRFESRNSMDQLIELFETAPMVAVKLLERLTIHPELKHEEVNVEGLSDEVAEMLVSHPIPSHAVLGNRKMHVAYEPVYAWRVDEDTKRWPDWHQELAPRPLPTGTGVENVSTRVTIRVVQYEELADPLLIKSIADSGCDEAFASVPIVALVSFGWDRVQVMYWLALAHDATTLAMLALLVSSYSSSDLVQHTASSMLFATACRDSVYEILQLSRAGVQGYFVDVWNYLDWAGVAIVFSLFVETLRTGTDTLLSDPTAKAFLALVLVQRWVKLTWSFRMISFRGIGLGVLSVLSTICPTEGMFVVIICTLVAFLHAFYALQNPNDDTDLVTSVLRLLLLGDGDGFDDLTKLSNSKDDKDAKGVSWYFVMLAIYFFIICILNLLITTLGEAYEKFQEKSRQTFLMDRASTTSDFMLRIVPRPLRLSLKLSKYCAWTRLYIALVFLFVFAYPSVMLTSGFLHASLGKFLGGLFLMVVQILSNMFVQPEMGGVDGKRFLWVCYDSSLDMSEDAILDDACGTPSEGADEAGSAMDIDDRPRVPQAVPAGMALAEKWVTELEANGLPEIQGSIIAYPCASGQQIEINLGGMYKALTQAVQANAMFRARIVPLMEEGDHASIALHKYLSCDKDQNGVLTWNNGEVREFVITVFFELDLVPPNDTELLRFFRLFDSNGVCVLDPIQCVCMIDAIFRAIFTVGFTPATESQGLDNYRMKNKGNK